MNVIALDISMGKSFMVLYKNGNCSMEMEFMHNQTGFTQLKEVFDSCDTKPEVVFEATGVYSRQVERFFQDIGCDYTLLNPLEARKQTDGLRIHKTDKSDAHKLAQSHYRFNRKKKVIQDKEYLELREYSRFYGEVEKQLKTQRMYLHAALQQTFPELEELFVNRVSKLALNLIEIFPHPDLVKGFSRTKLKNIIRAKTDKKISDQKLKEKAEQLLLLAAESYPAVSLDSFIVDKVRYLARELKRLIFLKENLQNEMIEKTENTPAFQVLVSIPGIGEITAALVIAELGDIHRFSNAKKLNAYVGIDIRRYQSGKSYAQDRINKRGNKRARMILFFAIKNMIRAQHHAPNHIVDYYYKLKKGPSPKKEKVAIVACMNRLIKSIHYLILSNKPYDYALSPQC